MEIKKNVNVDILFLNRLIPQIESMNIIKQEAFMSCFQF